MKVFQETTVWDEGNANHTYFMDDAKSRAYAYLPVGKTEIFEFKTPIKLDVRGRKFKEVTNSWNFSPRGEPKPVGKSWTITGSKGDKYVVVLEDNIYNCTCSGFQFRGNCKHIKEVQC